MVEGKPQSLRQVMTHPWGVNNDVALLRALGQQKGQLLKLLSSLPLRQLSGLTLHRKLVLSDTFGILTSRG
jgi:hypothetical protein